MPRFLLEVLYQSEKPVSWRTNTYTGSTQSEKSIRSRCPRLLFFYKITVAPKNQINSGFPLSLSVSVLCGTANPPTRLAVFLSRFVLSVSNLRILRLVLEELPIRLGRTVIASTLRKFSDFIT